MRNIIDFLYKKIESQKITLSTKESIPTELQNLSKKKQLRMNQGNIANFVKKN